MPEQQLLNFMPRGPGPLVSFLMPTRGRPQGLVRAIDSIVSLALNKSCMEFLLRIDDDDKATIEVAENLKKVVKLKTVVGPRGNGYCDMGDWWNELAKMSEGDWIFCFNDDSRVLTERWDTLIEHGIQSRPWLGIDNVCVIASETKDRPKHHEFLFVRRGIFEILGHLTLCPYADSWIYSIIFPLEAMIHTNSVIFEHDLEADDDTKRGRQAAFWKCVHFFSSMEAKGKILDDSRKLWTVLKNINDKTVWTPQPRISGWNLVEDDDKDRKLVFVTAEGKQFALTDHGGSAPTALVQVPDGHTVPGRWTHQFLEQAEDGSLKRRE